MIKAPRLSAPYLVGVPPAPLPTFSRAPKTDLIRRPLPTAVHVPAVDGIAIDGEELKEFHVDIRTNPFGNGFGDIQGSDAALRLLIHARCYRSTLHARHVGLFQQNRPIAVIPLDLADIQLAEIGYPRKP
jgi:hypothetical protein